MILRIFILFVLACNLVQICFAQNTEEFPELIITKIPGAPYLGKPQLVKGEDGNPLIAQGYGLAAPAFYDWDGDGVKDLLVGEFGSGIEFGRYMGNFIRVYRNIGTEEKPAYTKNFNYAWPPYELPGNGTPYSVDQFCCIGFTPQFIDLNSDGYQDMISGQYHGELVVFYRTEKGFLQGQPVKQEGDPRAKVKDYRGHSDYWSYSSAGFGDLTGDGKPDVVIGGRALRISKNIGTNDSPAFDKRTYLLDTKDSVVKIYEYSTEDKKNTLPLELYKAGDYKLSPVVTDWDNDGILDILVTNSYNHSGLSTIDFFKGFKINGEYCLGQQVPLFNVKNGKAFPGIAPHISVCDYNNDGIKDLLIGVSVVTLHDKFSPILSWNWEKDMGLQGTTKDPGYQYGESSQATMEWLMKEVKLPKGISKEDYATMKHVGYVYVMLGSKSN